MLGMLREIVGIQCFSMWQWILHNQGSRGILLQLRICILTQDFFEVPLVGDTQVTATAVPQAKSAATQGSRNHSKLRCPSSKGSLKQQAQLPATIIECWPGTTASCQTFDMLLPRLVYTQQVKASMGWPRWLHSKDEDYGHRACLTGWETWATWTRDGRHSHLSPHSKINAAM